MAHSNRGMDSEEWPHSCGRYLFVYKTRVTVVRMGMAVGCRDGGRSPCGGPARNRVFECRSSCADFHLHLQKCSRGIRAPTDCNRPNSPRHGGEHDSLACPTSP